MCVCCNDTQCGATFVSSGMSSRRRLGPDFLCSVVFNCDPLFNFAAYYVPQTKSAISKCTLEFFLLYDIATV